MPAGRLASAIALLLLVRAPPEPEGTLARAGEELAGRIAAAGGERGLIALAVSAPGAEGLAGPLETALSAALTRRGFATIPLRGARLRDPEASARALSADRLIRLTAAVARDKSELSLTAEDLPTRPSFFLQHAPQVRPAGEGIWSLTLRVDRSTLVLALVPARSPAKVTLRPLFQVTGPVLALAAGDPLGDGTPAIAAVTPTSVSLYAPTGALLASRDLEPGTRVRHPAATAAIGDFGKGRIALKLAGDGPGEVLSYHPGELRPVASLSAAPLAAVGRRRVFGTFLAGRATLADLFTAEPNPSAPPRTDREILAFAAAPRPGRISFAALLAGGLLELFDRDFSPADSPIPGVGAGFALADLDGKGEPELVASSAEAGPRDRVRVFELASGTAQLLFESSPVPGSILAGASADLTGDGRDDAVLASVLPSGDSQVWLITSDPNLAAEGGRP